MQGETHPQDLVGKTLFFPAVHRPPEASVPGARPGHVQQWMGLDSPWDTAPARLTDNPEFVLARSSMPPPSPGVSGAAGRVGRAAKDACPTAPTAAAGVPGRQPSGDPPRVWPPHSSYRLTLQVGGLLHCSLRRLLLSRNHQGSARCRSDPPEGPCPPPGTRSPLGQL